MRLVFLCTSSLDYPSPRGRWLPVAQELAGMGHDVHLALLHHTFDRLPADERTQHHGRATAHYVGQMHVYGPVGRRRYYGAASLLRFALGGAVALARSAIRLGAEAIHVCKPQPINGLAGVIAARRLGVPLYVDCDDYEAGGNRTAAGWQRQVLSRWEDRLPPRAAGVTVNTHFLAERQRVLGIPTERVAYVPNGIRAQRLHPPPARQVAGLRAALGLGEAPVALYLGTLSQTTHNVALLLRAFAITARRLPDARLLLVGEGEDRAALERYALDLGLARRTHFLGPAPANVTPAYLALGACSVDPVADDLVARARSPLKIVESLASGVPVVTGDVGDRREVIGGAGVITAAGDARSLAEGLELVLGDPQLRRRLAAQTRERAQSYRWDRLAPQWERIYH